MNDTLSSDNISGKQFNITFWHLILTVGVVFASLIFSYATLTSQLSDVNRRLEELSRRYYEEVVPRREHLEMNKRLDDRLEGIEREMRNQANELHEMNRRH